MREDMSRVIVERPRVGGARCRKGRTVAPEDQPSHEGMRRPWKRSGDWKMLNENLNPLRRYLERQVGRPWDKVYSEIARHLRADSTVQQHVRDHVGDFVAVKPRPTTQRFDGLWHQRLYVDPRDGILKRTDRLPEAKARRLRQQVAPTPPTCIALAADRELRFIEGIWYELTLAPLPAPEYRAVREVRTIRLKGYAANSPVRSMEMVVRRLVTPALRDVVTGMVQAGPPTDDEASWKEYRRTHPDRRYAMRKRTLSRSALLRHGLSNSPPVV